MSIQLKAIISKTSLTIVLSAGLLVLHAEPAEASPSPLPSGINLPADFQWSTGNNHQSNGTSISATNAINSLSYAKLYSSFYNSSWFYDLEIYFDKNLTTPSGNNVTGAQNSDPGSQDTIIQDTSVGTRNISPINPLSSLNYAELNSPSYNSTWVYDTGFFLNRKLHPLDENPTNVPEPGSLPILGTGLLGLAMIRRMRPR